jgi:hypothetical protein
MIQVSPCAGIFPADIPEKYGSVVPSRVELLLVEVRTSSSLGALGEDDYAAACHEICKINISAMQP